ncbi:MAG TPA: hypothetical protein VED41_11040 [Solirubrobacteraceae bacterium]|nr:hypothetical protein [Solirubrobacteraceae bacterium]
MRIKAAIGTVAAALACAGFGVSGAQARKGTEQIEALQLSERGTPVPAGATVVNENVILDGQCLQAAYAKVLSNDDPVDVLAVEPLAYSQCETGSELSGQLKYVAFSNTGMALAVAQPAFVLSTPGPCVYEFSVLEGQLTVAPEAATYIVGEATGLRNASASAGSCARRAHTEFTLGEWGADSFLLTPELTSITVDSDLRSLGFARPARTCAQLLGRVIEAAQQQEPGSEIASVHRGCH